MRTCRWMDLQWQPCWRITLPPLYHRIWMLAWPMMLSNISVPLLGLIDTAILGHLPSPRYLAAVALGASLMSFVFSGLNFLRMGTTGFSAQAFGQQDKTLATTRLQQGLLLAGLLGCGLLVLSPLLKNLGLYLLQVPEDIRPLSASYVQIRFLAAPAVLMNFVIIGWAIGQQQTRLALITLTASCLLNIALDYLLIMQLGLHSDGAAIATVITEYVSLWLALHLLNIRFPWLAEMFKASPWLAQLQNAAVYFQLNKDLFIRSTCLLFVFAFFHAQGAKLGTEILAANAILMQLILFQSYLLDGFANATEALVGEGQGQRSNQRPILQATAVASLATALLLCLLLLLIKPWLLPLFTQQPQVISLAAQQLVWIIWLPLISVWAYWLDGVAVGKTASRAMRNSMLLATWGVFIPCWWWFQGMGNRGLWPAFFVFLLSRGVLLLPILRQR